LDDQSFAGSTGLPIKAKVASVDGILVVVIVLLHFRATSWIKKARIAISFVGNIFVENYLGLFALFGLLFSLFGLSIFVYTPV
jgi:hypothetical protein